MTMRPIPDLDAFTDTRLQLHWLAQVPGALGATHGEPHPLWHHVALRWSPGHQALVTVPAAGTALRAGLRVADGTVLLLDGDGVVVEWNAQGKTFQDGVDWLGKRLAEHGRDAELQVRAKEKMPEHPVGDGAPISLDADAAGRLADLFDEGHDVLSAWAKRFDDAGPVLVWAHHFDIAVLRVVVPGAREDAEDARTIGYGITPGDASQPEPYAYVTPWPQPDAEGLALPALSVGHWNLEGWVGSVLKASENRGGEAEFVAWLEASNRVVEGMIGEA